MTADAPPRYDSARLRAALEQAVREANAALAAAPPPAVPGEFRYVDLRYGVLDTIPAAAFVRPSTLRAASVALTIHGYPLRQRAGRERPAAVVLSTRPPRWRRAPPLLALRIEAGADGSFAAIGPATRPLRADAQHLVVQLDDALQAQAALAGYAAPATPLAARLRALLARLFQRR